MYATKTKALIESMKALSWDAELNANEASALIAEAADRLERYMKTTRNVRRHCQDAMCREYPEERDYVRAISRIRDEIDW
jgi:chemotaxis regulatin CheY-phosphate phosphatase CheZ